ncbi:hypothetical protein LXL04_008456 [Taraxacum kok-saghyz]
MQSPINRLNGLNFWKADTKALKKLAEEDVKTSVVCGPHLQPSAAEEVDQTSTVCKKKTNKGKIGSGAKMGINLLVECFFKLCHLSTSLPITTYSLRKKPASDKHFTLAPFGKIPLKSSQWMSVASPPAEHPERSACHIINSKIKAKSELEGAEQAKSAKERLSQRAPVDGREGKAAAPASLAAAEKEDVRSRDGEGRYRRGKAARVNRFTKKKTRWKHKPFPYYEDLCIVLGKD